MAHQLHYTSSATGLSGYPGFQFVAVGSGVPQGVEYVVTRYLSYRTPPATPPLPNDEELRRLPVAFSYEQSTLGPVLARCRYLGADYSGRPGNFFGHVILADEQEMRGLRPIEFWGAPWWTDGPVAETAVRDLPDLSLTARGSGVEPERVVEEVATRERAATILGYVVGAVLSALDSGHGQVTLVARDVERIVTWMAAVSYSLPYSLVTDLSFITYTGEPDQSPYRLLGTTPDVWRDRGGRGYVFDLDKLDISGEVPKPGRLATEVARAWRSGDLRHIDVVSELADSLVAADGQSRQGRVVDDTDAAALLAGMCAGEPVDSDGVSLLVTVLDRAPDCLPEKVWRTLAADSGQDFRLELAAWRSAARTGRGRDADRIGVACLRRALQDPACRRDPRDPGPLSGAARLDAAQLARTALERAGSLREVAEIAWVLSAGRLPLEQAAVGEAAATVQPESGDFESGLSMVPDEYASCFVEGVIGSLEDAPESVRTANLPLSVCRRLDGRSWRRAPRVGITVLSELARDDPHRRVELTGQLLSLTAELRSSVRDAGELLAAVWPGMPNQAERNGLLAQARSLKWKNARTCLFELVAQPWDRSSIRQSAEYQIARQIDQLSYGRHDTVVTIDAWLITAMHEAGKGSVRQRIARAGKVDEYLPQASRPVARGVADAMVKAIVAFPPGAQAELMSRRTDASISWIPVMVRDKWLMKNPNDPIALANLSEIVIYLRRAEAGDPMLENHVRTLVANSDQLQAVFTELHRRDHSLADDFQKLTGKSITGVSRVRNAVARLVHRGELPKFTREPDGGQQWRRDRG